MQGRTRELGLGYFNSQASFKWASYSLSFGDSAMLDQVQSQEVLHQCLPFIDSEALSLPSEHTLSIN